MLDDPEADGKADIARRGKIAEVDSCFSNKGQCPDPHDTQLNKGKS